MSRLKGIDAVIRVTKQDLTLTQEDAFKGMRQEVLEAEMEPALDAGKGGRTVGRLGYYSG